MSTNHGPSQTGPRQISPDNLRFETASGREVKYYDNGDGPLWIYQETGGVVGIVRATTWSDAWECVLDEILTPIDDSELYMAYGFDSEEEYKAAVAKHQDDGADFPELAEGYYDQPDATGTGIVSVDLNGHTLNPLSHRDLEQLDITIRLDERLPWRLGNVLNGITLRESFGSAHAAWVWATHHLGAAAMNWRARKFDVTSGDAGE